MRKSILLLIVFLMGLGTMVHAQQDSESADLALYQKATKAIKDKKFVFKANLYDDGKRYHQVNPTENYIVLEDDIVTLSCMPKDGTGHAKKGKVSNFRLKTDKGGNLHLILSVKTYQSGFSRWNFYIDKGSNHCVVVVDPVENERGYIFIGELNPYNISDLNIPLGLNHLDRMKK